MSADLNELERLLREATAGPWKQRETLVLLGGAGGFDLRNCPRAAANAALIAALRNHAEELIRDARRYRSVRRGQHWSVINGIGDTLRAETLDAAVDAIAQEQP